MLDRRDFLRPNRLAHSAGQVIGAVQEVRRQLEEKATEDIALLRFGHRAMATLFEFLLPFGTPNAIEVAGAGFDLIDELEQQLTAYRDTSEICHINRMAYSKPVKVEPGLFELLQLARRIHDETVGAYDISAGALVKIWGFFRGPRRLPSRAELDLARSQVGMKHMRLDPENSTVRFEREGLELNLGSIGKGYALDRVAALFRQQWNLGAALVHGGPSSVYALGCQPGDHRGWPIGVRHPWRPEERIAVVYLRHQAMGTSAATFQYLEYNGRRLGHILDPRLGWPAEGMASVSVVAPTAAEADALSTAFFVLGEDGIRSYCASHPQVGVVYLAEGDAARPVVINLPDEVYTLLPA